MATLKYSRQQSPSRTIWHRPLSIQLLMRSICMSKRVSNIGLGTVYRNLNLLTDLGEAVKITTPDGGDRFDGDVRPPTTFLHLLQKGSGYQHGYAKMSQS